MILTLKRFNHDSQSTQGILLVNGEAECFTLEDEERCVKLSGQTRIPDGEYQIKLREETTGLTEKYRQRFPWFTYHLELQDVPNFKFVYIHIGNTHLDSEGCLLVGYGAEIDPSNKSSVITKSTEAFEGIYKKIRSALKTEEVWIVVESI